MKATQPGIFATAAQITNSQLLDPDSQPNSGTGDGQDDATSIDLRTPDATGQLVSSPNPNQTPLPIVQSNQPPTDPAKADLSLQVSGSSLVAMQNGLVSLTVTVSNQGGLAASNVVVQALLPAGWQVTNTSGLTVNGQTITASLGAVSIGGSSTIVYPYR